MHKSPNILTFKNTSHFTTFDCNMSFQYKTKDLYYMFVEGDRKLTFYNPLFQQVELYNIQYSHTCYNQPSIFKKKPDVYLLYWRIKHFPFYSFLYTSCMQAICTMYKILSYNNILLYNFYRYTPTHVSYVTKKQTQHKS